MNYNTCFDKNAGAHRISFRQAITHLPFIRFSLEHFPPGSGSIGNDNMPGARCKVPGARCKVKQERQQLIVFPDSGTVKCSNVPNLSALSRDA